MATQAREPKSPEEWIKRFLRAAQQRYTTAKFLHSARYLVHQMYVTGHVVECALKALILHDAALSNRKQTLEDLTRGAVSHHFERLKHFYESRARQFPLEDAKILRRLINDQWKTAKRSEAGKGNRKEASAFLKQLKDFLDRVKRRL
jgi:hypothetical protein